MKRNPHKMGGRKRFKLLELLRHPHQGRVWLQYHSYNSASGGQLLFGALVFQRRAINIPHRKAGINTNAKDENRQHWITLILPTLPMYSVTIRVSFRPTLV